MVGTLSSFADAAQADANKVDRVILRSTAVAAAEAVFEHSNRPATLDATGRLTPPPPWAEVSLAAWERGCLALTMYQAALL